MLLLSCRDQRGLVAAVADFIAGHGGNILHADQHRDVVGDRTMFFQRVEFELDGFGVPRDDIAASFAPIAERFGMTAEVRFTDRADPDRAARLAPAALPRRSARALVVGRAALRRPRRRRQPP